MHNADENYLGSQSHTSCSQIVIVASNPISFCEYSLHALIYKPRPNF